MRVVDAEPLALCGWCMLILFRTAAMPSAADLSTSSRTPLQHAWPPPSLQHTCSCDASSGFSSTSSFRMSTLSPISSAT